ncbi:glycerol-3-phosphate dehydrogenase SDP6, mitochondrial isoform X1 [Gossypium hirsutum]|uniref:Glycerol-3-phosphate dehydrogenase n=1 Tax=Gossypium hirsutum TaxID=3635 RepID=A0ABM3BU21_GOSHI|nr:glycerol-3-phosphate dehydrogenase SDP6, mitochondrial-like isoform X1 [Gossypium hirsutum]
MSASATRLRRLASVAVAVTACGGAVLLTPPVSSNDRASGHPTVESLRQIINDPSAVVPSRTLQESALIGTKSGPLDILVVGGGATGCGVALDAATRGLRVGLVEREDFSSGTSSRSTKLIHGGVRYLEKAVFGLDYGQLKLVFHALEERKQVIENAPHLCHALPCMTPCFDWFEVVYYWMGLKMYDLVAGRRLLHFSRYYSAQESVELFPTLASKGKGKSLRGTVVYYDGQMNDSRLNVGLACTAALAGAAVLNHAEVVSFLKDEGTQRIIGARIRDNLSGQEFDAYAKVVVNAAGPFCDSVRKMANKDALPMICPSSGVHIVLPDYYSPDGMGLIVPKTKDGRVVFMLPWLGRTIAGTTDSSTSITPLPEPNENEIQFILDAICDYLNVKVRRTDVLSAWSGIRPLAVDPNAKNTESISRDHVVSEEYPGLVTITGGKWTTYRSMAEDAVNAAIKSGKLSPSNECITSNLRLIGGDRWEPSLFTALAQQYVRMKKSDGGKVVPGVMDTAAAKHLSHAYGTLAERVATIAQRLHTVLEMSTANLPLISLPGDLALLSLTPMQQAMRCHALSKYLLQSTIGTSQGRRKKCRRLKNFWKLSSLLRMHISMMGSISSLEMNQSDFRSLRVSDFQCVVFFFLSLYRRIHLLLHSADQVGLILSSLLYIVNKDCWIPGHL